MNKEKVPNLVYIEHSSDEGVVCQVCKTAVWSGLCRGNIHMWRSTSVFQYVKLYPAVISFRIDEPIKCHIHVYENVLTEN